MTDVRLPARRSEPGYLVESQEELVCWKKNPAIFFFEHVVYHKVISPGMFRNSEQPDLRSQPPPGSKVQGHDPKAGSNLTLPQNNKATPRRRNISFFFTHAILTYNLLHNAILPLLTLRPSLPSPSSLSALLLSMLIRPLPLKILHSLNPTPAESPP